MTQRWRDRTTRPRALLRRARGASGAVTAQFAQALTSFVLHLAASRELGPSGLAVFALLYSGIILATAISTGMVGDSLTVLPRSQPAVRGGLQVVGAVIAIGSALIGAVVTFATGLLDLWPSLLLGAVVAVFVIEDLARRLLMASLRFWALVATDATALIVTIGWIIGTAVLHGSLRMTDLLLALLLGQCAGLVTAILCLPVAERHLAPWRSSDVRSVLGYGSWRAAQQAVRPSTLAATRSIAIIAVGAALFGQLEAARVYVAPALLMINGVASFLFSSYAAQRDHTRRHLLRRADVAAVALSMLALLLGLAAVAVLPVAGSIITAGGFDLDGVAVLGWVAYAACTALLTPYGGLAAVSGAHRQVFTVRVVESVASLLGVCLVLLWLGWSVRWVPYVLSPGALLSGLFIRRFYIVRGFDLDAPIGRT